MNTRHRNFVDIRRKKYCVVQENRTHIYLYSWSWTSPVNCQKALWRDNICTRGNLVLILDFVTGTTNYIKNILDMLITFLRNIIILKFFSRNIYSMKFAVAY